MNRRTRPAGHVQAAFERRTGTTLATWLREHGPTITLAEAARTVGYATPSGMRQWALTHVPDVEFRYNGPLFSIDEVREALTLRDTGLTWLDLSRRYGRNSEALRDACRRLIRQERAR